MTDEVLLPINSNAASMTAAPFNMVAIRMSWPGQSTNDTCLVKNQQVKSYGTVHKRYMPGEKSTNKYIWNLILFIIREFFFIKPNNYQSRQSEKLHKFRWDLWNGIHKQIHFV